MNILIIGKNSYVGKHFMEIARLYHQVTEFDVEHGDWENFDFRPFDAILHLAAIVHRSKPIKYEIYKIVNGNLPSLIAEKAIAQGVKHIVYVSSVAVWGLNPSFGSSRIITRETPFKPISNYGLSKLLGEENLTKLKTEKIFKLTIVRPPNVYGPNCPGNFYPTILKLSKFKIFPTCGNKNFSMISIYTLANVLNDIFEKQIEGIVCPQDLPVISMAERIKQLSQKQSLKQLQINCSILIKFINYLYPNKYINNLYGEFLLDTNDFKNP